MVTASRFQGIFTALITPFHDGKVDERAFAELIDWQVSEGVQGIVPCGTTGESPTLTHEEHQRVVELAVEVAAGRVLVIAGAGSNATEEAIAFTRHAKRVGADAVLQVSPYYNKPTQEGLYQHFEAIAECADIPNILYNIPGRSGVDIADATMARLASLSNIIGVKDATGDLARVSTLRAKAGKDFVLLSGEDMTTVGFNAMGGQGCISVTSNVAPAQCAAIQKACLAGDYKKALTLHEALVPLHRALFLETNPIPVKYAMHRLGRCSGEIRLPLTLPKEETREHIHAALMSAGLL